MAHLRGADILARALARAGVRHLFSLSGNQIMPVYDAALDARLAITHVRHEGAAVHMADAWGRLTGEPGIALLTGGPGHANGIGALYTALAAESPLVMLSGHAPLRELGRGAFQEMAQADMAAPVTKASWIAQSAAGLGEDMARAMRIARSGRPGPVHVSLPFDVLEANVDGDSASLRTLVFDAPRQQLDAAPAQAAIAEIAKARRPLILTGPLLAGSRGETVRNALSEATGAPVVGMESPRGVNDPCLGAFGDFLKQADLVVLLGKQADFTLRYGEPPAIDAACRFVIIDPDEAALRRTSNVLGGPRRVAAAAVADVQEAARSLCEHARGSKTSAWRDEVNAAIRFRPAAWSSMTSAADAPLHPLEVGRVVQQMLDRSHDAVLVADGGEFGQWAQACVSAPTRLINGPAGSIGSALPFPLAARGARPQATVVAMLGDGTFGFHMAEFDTALRAHLPFVAVVGNDACWNAEYQIQLRSYGRERAVGCELRPARYEQAVAGLGGHGEYVEGAAELAPALARAVASGLPACVNVMIERLPAPTVAGAAPAAAH
jgi:acetolactate synthase-1/2/3 large subunit